MLKIHFSQNDMRNMMLIQQTLIQYLLQKKNLCEIFKVLTIWGNINLFIRPQHHEMIMSKLNVTFRNPGDVLEFVRRVEKYPYDMDLSRGSIVVDAKSLLGIMNLGFNKIVSLKIYSEECEDLQQDLKDFIAA